MPRASLSIAIVALGAGLLLGRWTVRPDPELADDLGALKTAGILQDPLTHAAVTRSIALRDSLRWEREQRAADREQHAALSRRRISTPILAAQPVPDTCRVVVARLVEQLAIRDSIHELDSAAVERAEAAVQAWDRVAAGLAKEAIAEHVLRQEAQALAERAVKQSRVPRLQLEFEPSLRMADLTPEGRVDAVLNLGGRWRATAGYQATMGEGGSARVGLRFVL